MRVRFCSDDPACEWSGNGLTVKAKSCDRLDQKVHWKRLGIIIPDDAYVIHNGSRHIDKSKVSHEVCRLLEQDEEIFIAENIVEFDGLEIDYDGTSKTFFDLSRQEKADLLVGLRQSIKDFDSWCGQYVRGAEKKSGRMVID